MILLIIFYIIGIIVVHFYIGNFVTDIDKLNRSKILLLSLLSWTLLIYYFIVRGFKDR